MPLYRPILLHAWRMASREYRLAGYALFASVVIGSGIGTAILLTLGVDVSQSAFGIFAPSHELRTQAVTIWAQARVTGTGATLGILAFGAVLLAVVLATIWITTISANALIIAAGERARGNAIPTNLRLRAQRRFWPAFTIHLLAKIATALVLLAWGSTLAQFAITSVQTTATGPDTLRMILAFIVTVLLLGIVQIITMFAAASTVLDQQRPLDALREGAALLRARWLVTTEASALFSLVHIGSLIAFSVAAFLGSLPFIFLGGIGTARGIGSLIGIAIVGRIAVLAVLLLLTVALSTAFLTAAWTLLWIRLTSPGEEPAAWVHRFSRAREKRS